MNEKISTNSLEEEFLCSAEVLKLLGICRRTLQNYRNNGTLKFRKIGGKCYYSRRDLLSLLP